MEGFAIGKGQYLAIETFLQAVTQEPDAAKDTAQIGLRDAPRAAIGRLEVTEEGLGVTKEKFQALAVDVP